MENKLDKLSIEGFKSIRELKDLELKNVNILIGANGSGKSNFIEIFRLLQKMVTQNLSKYILNQGTADAFLFNGPKQTSTIKAAFWFGDNAYKFELERTIDQRFQITGEEESYVKSGWKSIDSGGFESKLKEKKDKPKHFAPVDVGYYVYNTISSWTNYHFHDTSNEARMKGFFSVEDNHRLKTDAANIAPLLLRIKNEYYDTYQDLIRTIRLIAPFFDDFILEPRKIKNEEKVKLFWYQKGSDNQMQPFHFSDGTLRFICLLVSLMQPNPPAAIIIDEPELGLHPEAIYVISEIIKSASQKTQVIMATQSPVFIDYFEPEDIVVVNREDGASVFQRLKAEELNLWLEDYTLGQLWRKNVIKGGTFREHD